MGAGVEVEQAELFADTKDQPTAIHRHPLEFALVTPVRLAGREGLTATGADGVLRRGEHASQGDIAAFEQESGREAELVFYPFEGKRRHPPGVCPVKRYSCAALVADCQFLFTVFSQPNRECQREVRS